MATIAQIEMEGTAPTPEQRDKVKQQTSERLRSYIERIESLTKERKGISDAIADVMTEAKADGFDKKAVREVLKRRAMMPEERKVFDDYIDTYMHALGMVE